MARLGRIDSEVAEWSRLQYFDPGPVLIRLGRLERELASVPMDSKVRRLRTNRLKRERESREAALFAYGLREVVGTTVLVAPQESGDHDFLVKWSSSHTEYFRAVQLKELVSADLNPRASLPELLSRLAKYPKSETVLAVHLNRRETTDLRSLGDVRIPFAELWFFGAATEDASKWFIVGDALKTPFYYAFDYPQR